MVAKLLRRSCRVCESHHLYEFLEIDGFHYERCNACELVQVTDDLTTIRLADYYGKSFYDDNYMWLQKGYKGRRREYEKFRYRIKEIEKYVPGQGNILDIGCSFGFFLDVARAKGWKATGVEMGEYAATFARNELHLNVHVSPIRQAALPQDYYDVITMWNVLAHLDDPLADIAYINKLLKTDGLLVLTTANVDSCLRKIQGGSWRAFIPPIHVALYNLTALRTLLKKTNFSLEHVSVALPRESILAKMKVITIIQKLPLSDKLKIFARKTDNRM